MPAVFSFCSRREPRFPPRALPPDACALSFEVGEKLRWVPAGQGPA